MINYNMLKSPSQAQKTVASSRDSIFVCAVQNNLHHGPIQPKKNNNAGHGVSRKKEKERLKFLFSDHGIVDDLKTALSQSTAAPVNEFR